MSKKALIALFLAIALPVIGYMTLKYKGEEAVVIPRKFLLDTVITSVEGDKIHTDSIWHKTKNITLVNQLGDTVSLYDVRNKIIVIDFIFTTCRSICPAMTANMRKLQESFIRGGNIRQKSDTGIVHFLSFTVDPERDSVMKLKNFADHFNANHDSWWFLTGDKKKIYDFAFEELKVDKFSDEPITPDFVHTNRFVLLDRSYRVRGYYNGMDTESLKQLARDVAILMLERQ